jgi:hypothetical protein
MSSSGLIYAVIVGAWAVYLVPMWLRREDELNRARETQRYAAAIKVLSNKEAFERRWAMPEAEALPIAAGQDFAGAGVPSAATSKRPVRATVRREKSTAAATGSVRRVVTARPNGAARPAGASARKGTRPARVAKPEPGELKPKPASSSSRRGLMARRRRVVSLLFAFSTLGALVSADLGAGYLWTMAVPALLLSTYIVRLRHEEHAKAAGHARRRVSVDLARDAELQTRDEAKTIRTAPKRRDAAEAPPEDYRRAQTTRRRSAAARSRAQNYVPQENPDLPRAANG